MEEVNQFIVGESKKKQVVSLVERVLIKDFELLKPNRVMLFSCEEMVQTKPKQKKVLREIYVFNDIIIQLKKNGTSKNPNTVIQLKNCDFVFEDQNNKNFDPLSFSITNILWNPKNFVFNVFCKDKSGYDQLRNVLEKTSQSLKVIYEYISLGLINIDKKNYPIKYCEISLSRNDLLVISATALGKYIWIAQKNSKISVLCLKKKSFTFELIIDEQEKTEITHVTNDGSFVYVTLENGKIVVYNNLLEKICTNFKLHNSKINYISYCEKEKVFATSDILCKFTVWKFSEESHNIVLLNKFKIDGQISSFLFFSLNDSSPFIVVSALQEDNSSKIFKISNFLNEQENNISEESFTINGSALCMAQSEKELWLGVEKDILVFDADSKFQLVDTIKSPHKRTKIISIIYFNKMIFSFGQDSSIKIWHYIEHNNIFVVEKHNDQIVRALVHNENIFSISKSGEILKFYFQFD